MRAEAYLRNRDYLNACKDCFAVLVADRSNPQALFLLARAFYELERYQQCLKRLEELATLGHLSVDALDLHLRTLARLHESETGFYHFEKLAKEMEISGQQWLDVASFTKHVVVKDAGTAGRGLFATKSFRKGDVVLSEKAFAILVTPPQYSRIVTCIDLVRGGIKIGYDELLYVRVIEELQRRPSVVPEFLKLCAGDSSSEVKGSLTVDGKVVLDT